MAVDFVFITCHLFVLMAYLGGGLIFIFIILSLDIFIFYGLILSIPSLKLPTLIYN